MPTRNHLLLLFLTGLTFHQVAWGETLTVYLKDPDNDSPMSGVKVQVYIDGQETQQISKQDGSVAIILPADGPSYGIRVSAAADGFLPTSVSWKRDDLEGLREYTISLKRGMTIGGRIQDEKGKPIQHVKVIMSIMPLATSKERTVVTDHVEWTNDLGEWRCSMAPEEIESVRIRLEHPYYIANEYFDYGSGDRRPIGPLKTLTDAIDLKKSLSIEGTVLNEKGQGIKGARVSMPGSRWEKGRKPSAITDENGRFRFNDLELGDVTLAAQAEGYAPESQKVSVTESNSLVRFRLSPAIAIRGRVVDKAGNPIQEVNISAQVSPQSSDSAWRGFSDQEGRFVWTSPPRQPVRFDFYGRGYARATKSLVPQEEEHIIMLGSPLVVSCTVEDAETGQRVPSYRVVKGIGWDQEGSPPHWDRYDVQTGGTGKFSVSFDQPYPKHYIRVEADGYEPAVSRPFTNDEGDQTWSFKLKKGVTLSGILVDSDGKPIDGAEIILCTPSSNAYIRNGKAERGQVGTMLQTNAEGEFTVEPQIEPFDLLALHERGVSQITDKELKVGNKFVLQPWARIQGTVRVGSKPAKGEKVSLHRNAPYERDQPRMYFDYQADTDADGGFLFERVIPGEFSLARMISTSPDGRQWSTASSVPITVKSGQTLSVELGGRGCPVKGHLVVPSTSEQQIVFGPGFNSLRRVPPLPPIIKKLLQERTEESYKKYSEWRETEEGKLLSKQERHYGFAVNADGSFHIDDVESGSYTLTVQVFKPDPINSGNYNEPVGMVAHKFRIPEMPGGRSDEPLDLGDLPLIIIRMLKPGDTMPAIDLRTGENETIKVSDYRGKLVLLSFWSKDPRLSSGADSDAELLKSLAELSNTTSELVVLRVAVGPASLGGNTQPPQPPRIVDCSMNPQDLEQFFRQYRISAFPQTFVLDRNGKILAMSQKQDEIMDGVKAALGK